MRGIVDYVVVSEEGKKKFVFSLGECSRMSFEKVLARLIPDWEDKVTLRAEEVKLGGKILGKLWWITVPFTISDPPVHRIHEYPETPLLESLRRQFSLTGKDYCEV